MGLTHKKIIFSVLFAVFHGSVGNLHTKKAHKLGCCGPKGEKKLLVIVQTSSGSSFTIASIGPHPIIAVIATGIAAKITKGSQVIGSLP